jgi:Protein of unknown function (DUF2530)
MAGGPMAGGTTTGEPTDAPVPAPVVPPEPEPPLVPLNPPGARPAPPPLEANTVRLTLIGIALWFVAFLVLLPMRGRLTDDGHEIWLWTCLAGWVLGLIGLPLAMRARSAARRRSDARSD